jgi:hypothetical protein
MARMTDTDRRDFLKKSAAAAAALGVSGRAASQASPPAGVTLRAIGDAVLPAGELGPEGVERVAAGFQTWIAGFEPQAEMPHGYLSRGLARIRYGPEHPGPRWAEQVESLERAAQNLHATAFADLSVEQQRELIGAQLEDDDFDRLPDPARAPHVALGLLAFFYESSEATDLCYRARIGRFRCRGLRSLQREPEALPPRSP